MPVLVRAALVVAAYFWAEWVCLATDPARSRLVLARYAVGLAPLLLAIFWRRARKPRGRAPDEVRRRKSR